MERKHITFFIVSNESGKTRKLVLPSAWLKFSGFAAGLLVLALTAGLVDYFGLLIQSMENKRLKTENAQLVKQFQIVESKVSSLENSLERVKTFTQKLQLITNINGQDRILKLTVGAKPAPGQQIDDYEPMDQRMAPQEMAAQDQVFAPEKPVDERKGEVAVEPSTKARTRTRSLSSKHWE